MKQIKKFDKISMTKIKDAIKRWIFLMVIVGITLSAMLLYVVLSFEQMNTIDKVEFISTKERTSISADVLASDDEELRILCGEEGYDTPTFLMNNADNQKNLKDKDMGSLDAANLAVEAAEKLYDIDLNGSTVYSELYDGYYNDELTTVWLISIYSKNNANSISVTLNSVTGEIISAYNFVNEYYDIDYGESVELRKYYDDINKYYNETMDIFTKWFEKKSNIEGIWYSYVEYSKEVLGEMLKDGGKLEGGIYNYYYTVTTVDGEIYTFNFDSAQGFVGFESDIYSGKWYLENESDRLYPEDKNDENSTEMSYEEQQGNVNSDADSAYSWNNNVTEEYDYQNDE